MDFIGGAKTLVPEQWRPASVKDIWTDPVLSSREFISVVATIAIFMTFGLFLYYSFYVAFILCAAETLQPKLAGSQQPRIGGSYQKTIRHMISNIGWGHFLGGMTTFLWTAVLAFLGRWAITIPEGTSLFFLSGGPQVISNIIFEPLAIIFTHYVLTTSPFNPLRSFQRLLLSRDFYASLVYIGTVQGVITALQATLPMPNANQHYLQQLMIYTNFLLLMLIRILLTTRIHASLLPQGVQTTIDLSATPQSPLSQQLWQFTLRIFKLAKLLFTC
ncbi:hypothetical protein FRC17_008634, partial [Serendipita sp. 399]